MALQTFTAGQVLTAAQMTSLQANAYNQTVSTKTASYTLVAADKGTRVVMNNASTTTITVNTSLFTAGDTLFIQNIGAGVCTVTAGTATVTTAGSLALAQWGGGTLYFTSASAAIFFSGSSPAYGTATGGIGAPTAVTISGVNYEYLTFNSTGTLTVTKSGFFDYMLIGGGTGCYQISTASNAGGGAGQVSIGTVYLDTNQTITIGAGSAFSDGLSVAFNQASNTTLGATSPFAPTGLGGAYSNPLNTGRPIVFIGGGQGCCDNQTAFAVNESVSIGFRGGNTAGNTAAGGGGGQSSRGSNGSGTTGGAGGNGVDISTFIGGSAAYRATGGGGGGTGTGGSGGNSNASSNSGTTSTAGDSANANSGSGGGGGSSGTPSAGAGGSGVAFIRYKV